MSDLERHVGQTLGPAFDFFSNDEAREQNANARTEAIIEAIREAGKLQAAALERGLREIADALRSR